MKSLKKDLAAAMRGKIVVVTGASFGIGEASARQLAGAGATVLLLARSAEKLEALAAELRAGGGAAFAYPVDLADGAAVSAVAARALAEHGHVDVVVSNAGKSIRRSLAHSYGRMRDFRRTIEVNYLGPVQLLLALLPSMRARRAGHIVNVSTLGVRVPPSPRWGAYQASKAAFDTWLRSVTPELRADGVTVSSIYMGLVHTRMSAPTAWLRRMPGLTPEQAGALVCRAVATRPRDLGPWWMVPAGVVAEAARGPVEALLAASFRASEAAPTWRLGAAAAAAVARAGILAPPRPDRLVGMLRALRLGTGPATLAALAAARDPGRVALVDDEGALRFAELEARAHALAALLAAAGVGPGRVLGVMCKNHRGFVEAVLAGSRLGADLLLLNTEFPGPQLAQALARHELAAAVLDEELVPAFDAAGYRGPRVLASATRPAAHAPLPPPPRRQGKIIVLTSGTTGTPKGAPRAPSLAALLGPLATVLDTIGLRAHAPLLVAPPLFHGFGLAYLGLALALRAPLVLTRRFEAEATLAAIARTRVATLVVVPVMLQRILELPAEVRRRHDVSSLRAVISAGAPLAPALATAFMDAFGDCLYNLYGSTETGFASIATPADLRAAPGTVGRAPLGVTLRVLDAARAPAPAGVTGRIFVGSAMTFEGYSGGGSKETVGGLMSTGDLGHVDACGRLFVEGREDDMIVSGGENVFPQEVEELLARHADVADAAVVGVADAEFGQRLRAFVVPRAGRALSVDELRAYVRRHVARYKVPRDVIVLAELPRNPTGKLLRGQLPHP
jgi:acyl-CoA synthetase (AMP-forming)/AMP-acid ligase II/NAD(P)-dependent dehydrogenase (short-subunit alcohol dehydrogenase family)